MESTLLISLAFHGHGGRIPPLLGASSVASSIFQTASETTEEPGLDGEIPWIEISLIHFVGKFRICWLTGEKFHPSSTTSTSNPP